MTTNHPYITCSDGSRSYGRFHIPEISTEYLRFSYTYSFSMMHGRRYEAVALCCDIPMFEGASENNTVHLTSMAVTKTRWMTDQQAKYNKAENIREAAAELQIQICAVIRAIQAQYRGETLEDWRGKGAEHVNYGARVLLSLDNLLNPEGDWIKAILDTSVAIIEEGGAQ